MTTISITELEQLCIDGLIKAGLRDKDARITVDHLLENEMSGKASHGMVRVVEAAKAIKKHGAPSADPEIEIDNGNMVTINANRQIGVVAGMAATNTAIERAKQHGLALIGARDYIATSGSMAYYLRRIADAGIIAIMGCNSVALVAPPGGTQRRIGTNPIGIAIPGESVQLIGDLGTAAMAYGKMMVAKDKGEELPEGKMIDKDGNPSTNPKDAYEGAILPLEGHKGFALGLMIELLAGPLIGAHASKDELYDNDGLFIITIDPSKMGHENYALAITNTLKRVKDTLPMPGHEAVSLPGERSERALKQAKMAGEIDVADKTLNDLQALLNERE